jgi:hypothetical protein
MSRNQLRENTPPMDGNSLRDNLHSAGAWFYSYHDYIFIGLGVLVVLVVWRLLK